MLKTTGSPDVSKPEIGNGNGGIIGIDVGGSGEELAKKSGKSKGEKLKKLSKFRKSAKLGKNLLKSGNSPNFGATEAGPNFLTPKARAAFNRLWLAFTKALIFWHLIHNATFGLRLIHWAMLLVGC